MRLLEYARSMAFSNYSRIFLCQRCGLSVPYRPFTWATDSTPRESGYGFTINSTACYQRSRMSSVFARGASGALVGVAPCLRACRQYASKAEQPAGAKEGGDLGETGENESRNKKKGNRKTRRKKELPTTPAPETGPDLVLNFPFEGKRKKVSTKASGTSSTPPGSPFTACIVSNESGERVYNIQRDGLVFQFPSVTTILGGTMPKKRAFMLDSWRKGLVKERGEGGYQELVEKTRGLGSRFHKVR